MANGTGAAAVIAALAEQGHVVPRPEETGRTWLDELLQRDTTFAVVRDGIVHVPSLVEGTTWTVFVEPDDAD